MKMYRNHVRDKDTGQVYSPEDDPSNPAAYRNSIGHHRFQEEFDDWLRLISSALALFCPGPDSYSKVMRIVGGTVEWSYDTSNEFRESAVDPDGYVYVADDHNALKFNPDGSLIWKNTLDDGSNDYDAVSIAVAPDRSVYVGSGTWYKLIKLASDGSWKWTVTIGGVVYGLDVDTNNNAYAGGADWRLQKRDPDGNRLWITPGTDTYFNDSVDDVAVSTDGYVYVAIGGDGNGLKKIDKSDGSIIWTASVRNEGDWNYCNACCVDKDNYPYMLEYISADEDYYYITKLDKDGSKLKDFRPTVADGSWYFSSIKVGKDMNIYCAFDDGCFMVNADMTEVVWQYINTDISATGSAMDTGVFPGDVGPGFQG